MESDVQVLCMNSKVIYIISTTQYSILKNGLQTKKNLQVTWHVNRNSLYDYLSDSVSLTFAS